MLTSNRDIKTRQGELMNGGPVALLAYVIVFIILVLLLLKLIAVL